MKSLSVRIGWIAFSPANGKTTEKCKIVIDSTLVFEPREDVVRIQTASGYKDITIVQEGFKPQINPKKKSVQIEDFDIPSKRKFEVVVETNVELTKPADTEWLTCKMSEQTLDRGARPRNVTLTFEWRVNPYADVRKESVRHLQRRLTLLSHRVELQILKVSRILLQETRLLFFPSAVSSDAGQSLIQV